MLTTYIILDCVAYRIISVQFMSAPILRNLFSDVNAYVSCALLFGLVSVLVIFN